jgi:hypothetical protein
LEFGQIRNLPRQNWNSSFDRAKLEYYFFKPQNFKKIPATRMKENHG